jgi:hypothetical protein
VVETFAAHAPSEPIKPGDGAESASASGVPERNHVRRAPTLSLEEAGERLGPQVLQALEDRFNGSLAEIRVLDEKDQLFQ